jgi:virginiamycin B lyase
MGSHTAMSQATGLGLSRRWSWRRWLGLALATAVVSSLALFAWRIGPWSSWGCEEFRLPKADIPVAIAVAHDGTVWFTLESSDTLGLLREGRIEMIPKGAESVEPLGLAVDAGGRAWYTEAPKQRISRASTDGTIASFGLSTPVARLGRLAVGPEGGVWFAEPSVGSITHFKDERFTRHVVGELPTIPVDAAPFGVAVAPDGTVWATLQHADKLLRIGPDGKTTTFDVPTPRSGLGDIAVDDRGTVWFIEMGANKIGRFADGRFEEFTVPTPSAGLTALAVAPDGAAWFTELRAHRLGRLHGGVISEFALPRRDARPFGISVDAANNVWYTDLSGWVGRLNAARARVR